MVTRTASTGKDPDRAFLGHPKGLGVLSFSEAFERFSYYGMQALLVLYMVKYLLLPGKFETVWLLGPLQGLLGGLEGQPLASAIFGLYTSLVYLTPILGGIIADRFLGRRKTVLAGAILMAVGHFLMAFEPAFLLALLCLIFGTGLFKGNIASQVGGLYAKDDIRSADAFQIFYLGINAGVIASPLIVGTLGEKIGWHWGFGAAGIGMLIGLLIYVWGTRHLPADPPRTPKGEKRAPLTSAEKRQTLGLFLLIPVMALAVIPNNQIFNAYMFWGDQQFNLSFGDTRLPTTWLVTLDAIVSVSLLAGVALFWRWWGKTRQEPDEMGKILIGSLFTTSGMLVLALAAATQGEGKIGLTLPVLFHVLNSIGFAHIMPVTLALFAKVAPASMNSTVIGLYYLAFAAGNWLVGRIGGLFATMQPTQFWLLHAAIAASAGFAFLLFRLFLWKPATQTTQD